MEIQPPSRDTFTGPFGGREELAVIRSRQASPGIALAHALRDLARLTEELAVAYDLLDQLRKGK